MSKTLDEIIAAAEPGAMRKSLEQKLQGYQSALADSITTYEIEQANPRLEGKDKEEVLAPLEVAIHKWDWAVGEVKARLDGADEALHGGGSKP